MDSSAHLHRAVRRSASFFITEPIKGQSRFQNTDLPELGMGMRTNNQETSQLFYLFTANSAGRLPPTGIGNNVHLVGNRR